MTWLTNPDIWLALITLTALEIVLGIDNIIFIAILAGKLPQHQQAKGRDDASQGSRSLELAHDHKTRDDHGLAGQQHDRQDHGEQDVAPGELALGQGISGQ